MQHALLLLINLLLFSLHFTLYATRRRFVELGIYILLILLPSAPCNSFSRIQFAFLIFFQNRMQTCNCNRAPLARTDASLQFCEGPCPVWFLYWALFILPLFLSYLSFAQSWNKHYNAYTTPLIKYMRKYRRLVIIWGIPSFETDAVISSGVASMPLVVCNFKMCLVYCTHEKLFINIYELWKVYWYHLCFPVSFVLWCFLMSLNLQEIVFKFLEISRRLCFRISCIIYRRLCSNHRIN